MGALEDIQSILKYDNLDQPLFGIRAQLESWVDELSDDGWHNYGDYGDFTNPFHNITIGNGTLVARWWTPQPVKIAFDQAPFLVHVYVTLKFGSTTTVDGIMQFRLPTGLEGGFEIDPYLAPSDSGSPDNFGTGAGITATARIATLTNGRSMPGLSISPLDGAQIISSGDNPLTGSPWDATHPGTWAPDDVLGVQTTFLGAFYGD